MPIAISVVIPTRNRREPVVRCLRSLAAATRREEEFEAIVVADGCADGTAKAAGELSLPYPLTVVESAHRGRAAARNLGAGRARGEVILLLHDDMEALPGLLEAHLRAHRGEPAAVLGRFPIVPARAEDQAARLVRSWWERHFAAWGDPSHRFGFADFCTGNVSIPRKLFEQLGGFDESIPPDAAGEDWEFGHRLLAWGAALRHAPDAESVHHDRPGLARLLRRADEEGRGHVWMASLHPALRDRLPLGALAAATRNGALRPVVKTFWLAPGPAGAAAAPARLLARVLARSPLRAAFRGAQAPAAAHAYWSGVRSAMPDWERWTEFCAYRESGCALRAGARP